jgi:hypothetical protein
MCVFVLPSSICVLAVKTKNGFVVQEKLTQNGGRIRLRAESESISFGMLEAINERREMGGLSPGI